MELNGKLFENALIVGMVFFTLSACNGLDERDEILSKEYQLEDIVWGKMADDETSFRTYEETKEYVAESYGTKYRANIFPLEDYMLSSQFLSDDPELFNHLIGVNPPMLSIPSENSELSADLNWHVRSATEVPLELEVYSFAPDSYSKDEIEADVPFKIQASFTIEEYHVAATYKACFKEINGNGSIEIVGKWKGLYYRCKNTVFKSASL